MRNLVFRDSSLQPHAGIWDLLDDVFTDFTRDVSRIKQSYGNDTGGSRPQAVNRFNPNMDIEERDGAYLVSIDLPGVKLEDVNIRVDEDTLTISGKRSKEVQEGGKYQNYKGKYLERHFGEFSRSLNLSKEIKQDAIEASFQDGVLQVVLPKQKPKESTLVKIKSSKSNSENKQGSAALSEKDSHSRQ